MELENRVVLVTGGARRIGRAIALELARCGCRIALHFHGSADEARQTVSECCSAGVQAEALQADLGDPEACSDLVQRVHARFGSLDILVNNASTFETMALDDFDLAAWDHTMRVNLTAPLVLVHAARAALRSARGRVVNLCDAAADRPWPDYLAYMVSKGALETLTRVLARTLAPEVNVVGIAPGIAAWPEHFDAQTRDRLARKIPLRRPGTPAEVAAAVRFVLRDGDFITGAILPVDGGRQLR